MVTSVYSLSITSIGDSIAKTLNEIWGIFSAPFEFTSNFFTVLQNAMQLPPLLIEKTPSIIGISIAVVCASCVIGILRGVVN